MIEQFGIAVTGAIAVALSQSRNPQRQRWACIFGLAGQPFWFVAAISADQWGVLVAAALYTAAWGKGLFVHWVRRPG